ncbi:MAG: Rrf2 family transcriptional regulator [Spirochaetales bacterium]|nr:Rrf2 family transcriptional regulator [Spirochaetales bacterium]
MRFTKDIEYALMACAAMDDQIKPISAKEISRRFQIPYELLSKILQNMSAHNDLKSIQGPKGGYVLNKTLEHLTIGDIVLALRGDKSIADCVSIKGGQCPRFDKCVISPGMIKLQKIWDDILFNISVKDFIKNEN